MLYLSRKEAEAARRAAKRKDPSGRYTLRHVTFGNKLAYQLVDTARFSRS